ncbi:MAG TPA: DNA repair protein RecN [Bacteroidales bacterium]|nr:DNA repair protein RecN [Bacteroidales bacterium]
MLLHLSIENYILIRHLSIDFEDGFSVITGETGAGKSILVGALGLVLGQRADVLVLHDKTTKCIVEGTFGIKSYGLETFFAQNDLDYETITTVRREITPQGKSRAFINDTPVNLQVLKELGDKLVDIHSQNQTLELNEASFQLSLIDSYAARPELLRSYTILYDKFNKLQKDYQARVEQFNKSSADRDYKQFLYDELQHAAIKPAELEEAEEELRILTHAEEIKSKLFAVLGLLGDNEVNILNQLSVIRQTVAQASHYSTALSQVNDRLESSFIELKDLDNELRGYADKIQYDTARIEDLTTRTDLINHLLQKHKVHETAELLELQQKLLQDLGENDSLQLQIKEIESELAQVRSEIEHAAIELSQSRKKVIPDIESEIMKKLAELGMPAAIISIAHQQTNEMGRTGIDKVLFMFSANKGSQPREIQKVASGGELSRIMLAVKSLVVSRNMLPTILFDEIDSGVSGEIAGRIGNILHHMSANMQVIAITHLPQIAGKCRSHYLAYKLDGNDSAFSSLRKLSNEERITEIARMLSDDTITEKARAAAVELIRN